MTIGQISVALKKLVQSLRKIIVAFLFAFCFQNLDVYGSENCCDKCCEDCCKGDPKKENEDKNKEYYLVGGDLEEEERKKLVSEYWYAAKDPKPVLKIFTKVKNKTNDEGGNIKITIKNGKIEAEGENKEQLKLGDKTYALFKIIKKDEGDPIYLYCSNIGSDEDDGIFQGCTHTEISVIASDTTNVANMSNMFYSCNNLEVLNIDSFNTQNVIDMKSMFYQCESLTSLDLNKFNTENVRYMHTMFYQCKDLKTLYLSNFDTGAVKNMSLMFSDCKQLDDLNLTKFNTANVTNMGSMFNGCKSLKNITLTDKFRTATKAYKGNMFKDCWELFKAYGISDKLHPDEIIQTIINNPK